ARARGGAGRGGGPPRRGCLLETVDQTPTRDDGVARGRAERTAATPYGWRGAGSYCDPAVAGRQPRGRALPAGRTRCSPGRRSTLRTPAWVGRWCIRQRCHQRPLTARAPFALPFAHVPPSAALGAHLDHRTSVTARLPSRGKRPSKGFRTSRRALKRGPATRSAADDYPQFPQVYPHMRRGYRNPSLQPLAANGGVTVDKHRGNGGAPLTARPAR